MDARRLRHASFKPAREVRRETYFSAPLLLPRGWRNPRTECTFLRRLSRLRLKRSLEACRVGDTDANHSGKKSIDLVSQRLAGCEQHGFHLTCRVEKRA